MKVALQTWGSDGDIRPLIALAAGLVQRGHRATLSIGSVDNKDYAPMCRAVSVAHLRAPEVSPSDVSLWMSMLGKTRNPFKLLRFMHEQAVFPSFDEMHAAAEKMIAGADLAVGHFLAVPLRIAAHKAGVPYASVAFWPGLVPDRTRPPEGFPNLGPWLNALLWSAANKMLDGAVGEGYRAFFAKHGLASPGGVLKSIYSSDLNLIASSASLFPHVKELGAHRFCGNLSMPGEAEPGPLPPALEDFLSRGEPPVFITLGSMGQVDPHASEQLLLDIAEASGERAIVQRDLRRPEIRSQTDRLAFVGKLSHAAILPRCSAILHHGGAGTTHTALAAGCPSVVCGFMDEQLSWGRALIKSGVATKVFRYGASSPQQLGDALHRAARDAAMGATAKELGAKLQSEDGVAEACRQLDAFWLSQRKIL